MSELPKGWAQTTIGVIARIETGFTPPKAKSEYYGGGIPFYKPGDLEVPVYAEQADEYVTSLGAGAGRLFPAGTVLVTCIGNLGKTAILRKEAIANQQINAILPTDAAESKFLFYWVKTIKPWLEENSSATTVTIINKGRFSGAPIVVPPKDEQRRIVAKLDSLRARSSRARRELDHIPKLIERYKQAILAKAFSGELTKDWREQHLCDASQFMRTTGIAAADNNAADPLPKGWYWAHAGEICAIKSGIALGKKRTADKQLVELPYLRVANVQRGWLNLSEIKKTLVTLREAEALYLQAGDVLMNEGGDRDKLGRGWVWEGQIDNCIHQNHVFRLRPKSSQIPSRYISYYANEFGQRYFLDEGKQTTNLASISMSKVSALPIPICTPDEMEMVVQRIESAFSWLDIIATDHSRAEHLLPKLDQAILAKAFRGELVPQNPNDEPASVLLERIKAKQKVDNGAHRRGRRKKS